LDLYFHQGDAFWQGTVGIVYRGSFSGFFKYLYFYARKDTEVIEYEQHNPAVLPYT
jgi:hypothetical protein